MKKLWISAITVFCLLLLNGCSPVPNEKIIETDISPTPTVQVEEDLKAEEEKANQEFKLKLEMSEKQYEEKRVDIIKEAIEKNNEERSSAEERRIARDKAEQGLFQSKLAALEKSEMSLLEVINNREMDNIALEYKVEMERIKKEFEAKVQRIKKEYDLKVEKINREYEDTPYEWDKMEEDLKAAEEAKFNQEYEAKSARINQEFNSAQVKAENEKAAQKAAGQRVLSQENRSRERKAAMESIIRDYEEKVKSAKVSRDASKESFKENLRIKYDAAYNKLTSEERMTDSIWGKLISLEKQELTDFFGSEDKKYDDYIGQAAVLKKESVEKILK